MSHVVRHLAVLGLDQVRARVDLEYFLKIGGSPPILINYRSPTKFATINNHQSFYILRLQSCPV